MVAPAVAVPVACVLICIGVCLCLRKRGCCASDESYQAREDREKREQEREVQREIELASARLEEARQRRAIEESERDERERRMREAGTNARVGVRLPPIQRGVPPPEIAIPSAPPAPSPQPRPGMLLFCLRLCVPSSSLLAPLSLPAIYSFLEG